jgi:hypothetical protein
LDAGTMKKQENKKDRDPTQREESRVKNKPPCLSPPNTKKSYFY